MYFVYVIYSQALDSYYVGYSSDPEVRSKQHNEGFYFDSFTSKSSDWNLFYVLKCNDKTQALKIEKHIKRMKSRKYLQDLAKYPEIGNKLLIRYV